MSEYALTERNWLEFRKDVCFRCKKRRQTCSLQLRDDCRKAGYPIRDLAMVILPDYRDAAEFESKAKVILARYNADDSCVPGGLMYCDSPDLTCFDCRIANANILAEQEMRGLCPKK